MSWPSRLTLLLLGGAIGATLGGYWWLTLHDPGIRFLPEQGPAQWIVYPVPPNPQALPAVEREAVFRRSFFLDQVPETARLQIRALGRCRVTLNGMEVELPEDMADHWKRPVECDVSRQLTAGANHVTATVRYDYGPPALWLSLTADGFTLHTDGAWQVSLAGAVAQPARAAATPLEIGAASPLAGGERTVDSARACWPLLLLFAGLAFGALAAAHFWEQRHPGAGEAIWTRRVLVVAAVLWAALFLNNVRTLFFPVGFDAEQHLEYAHYIQERGSLPLADAGWQMHQPPLFYLIAAMVLHVFGLASAVVVLRLLTLVLGVIQLLLVAGCLRLIFPGRPRAQVAGLVVGAFLPAGLYLFHYVTNEALLAVLGTASVYLCLRILHSEHPSTGRYLGLGVCLGAALLTKVTALVLVAVVLAVLAGCLAARRETALRAWLGTVGVTLVAVLVVSGWHFVRVWARFGTPLVGSYDPVSSFVWWQDPGYGNLGYLLRFGRSLCEPFFAAVHSFGDGLYSTLWGDGLWGGVAARAARPPWNYELMAAGYLLALLPTALVAVGAAAAMVQLVRRPRAEWFLLIGLAFALAVALVYHFLRLPYFCHVKAFYALMALVPLTAFAGWGFDLLARAGRTAAVLLGVALGAWALTAYASFWVQPDSPATQAWLGIHALHRRDHAGADRYFQNALRADPGHALARLARVQLLVQAGRNDEARRQIQQLLEQDPDSVEARLIAAALDDREGKPDAAEEHLRRAVAQAPEQPGSYEYLGALLNRKGAPEEAIEILRQGLAVAPASPVLHAELAAALTRTGETEKALARYRTALRLAPNHPRIMSALARLLATGADARLRDGPEAVRLAEQACRLTHYQEPALLDTLAAAYAEAGRFLEAVQVQQRAIERVTGPPALRDEMEERLKRYEAGRPWHAGP